ncbi:MAG TPA: DNA-binding transcriptional regulator [Pseudoalteromonas prydzensis]|uniref:DNA-binding transcriptional regulator n=1 Tax=Pseudoalteromonas prydzensis TaxID=182141 RepID=A0A7V1D0W8_9GAMM|nr:DNA-binding transcriptional regulator [Pseudoalteromonas prydzensis]HEA17913.1 DNA-binding transcriptional regulator [Pseudoalteromonas prydzensis]
MSDILTAVHKTAKGLQKSKVINKTTMRKFDALCLTTVHEFTPEQVRSLRQKNNLSQPVFARYFNVSDKLVKKWEQGESKPRGAALKMLSLAQKKGLETIA